MKPEIEVKFVSIDHVLIRKKLKDLGATLEIPMRLMRRVTIDNDFMKSKDAFLRVRDEGNRTTMTYKQFDELSASGAKEIEVIVNDFEDTVHLLENAGLVSGSFQESKREQWRYGNTEIVLDEWPWLDPYIEIEGEDEDALQNMARLLDLDWKDAIFGDVMAAYRKQYSHLTEKDTVGNLPEVRFDSPLPKLLKP